jgi:hypothetical protein
VGWVRPELVVVSAVTPERLEGTAGPLRELAAKVPLALGGHGADEDLAAEFGAQLLLGDPVMEAERLLRAPLG